MTNPQLMTSDMQTFFHGFTGPPLVQLINNSGDVVVPSQVTHFPGQTTVVLFSGTNHGGLQVWFYAPTETYG